MIHTLVLYGSAALTGILFVGIISGLSRLEAGSSGITWQICEEVAHEVNNAYTEGLISESDARQIIDNCFEELE